MFEIDERPINIDLMNAVAKGDQTAVKHLIARGANPFATLNTSLGLVNIFMLVFSRVDDEILSFYLKHAEQHGLKIDLSKPIPTADKRNKQAMNFIQFAMIFSGYSCWTLLEKYYNNNKIDNKSFADLLNQDIYVKHEDGEHHLYTLAHLLATTLSVSAISANAKLSKVGHATKDVNAEYAVWLKGGKANPLPPDLIRYSGPNRAIDFALSRGMDVLGVDHTGTVAANIFDWDQGVGTDQEKAFEKFVKSMGKYGVEVKATYMKNQMYYIESVMKGFNANNPMRTTIEYNQESVRQKYKEAKKAQTAPVAPAVLHIHTKLNDHDQHLTRLDQATEQANKTAQEAKKLAEATAVKLNKHIVTFERTAAGIKEKAVDALRAYPEVYTDLFLGLYSDVESLLRQKKDAKLKVFTQNPSKEDRIAQTVLGVCSFALQASGTPFAALIPSGLEVLRSYRTELKNARTNKAVAEATVKVEPAALATMIALLITNQAMDKFGTDNSNPQILDQRSRLFAKVQSQVNKLGTTNVHDVEDAIAFLAMDAINLVNATSIAKVQDPVVLAFKSTNKSGSSSGSCSDDAPSLAAISDGSRTPPRNQTAVMAAALRKVQESQMQQNVRNTRTARSRGCVLQ